MGYCGIQSAKIIRESFYSPFANVNDISFSIIGKEFSTTRTFYNLNKMCFYYEDF